MIIKALVANGAEVYITGRREEALNKVVETYSTGPGKIVALPGDISGKADVGRLAKSYRAFICWSTMLALLETTTRASRKLGSLKLVVRKLLASI